MFSYVGGCHPAANNRCRPMSSLLSRVLVQAWSAAWPCLSSLSQIIPPNHVQVLFYCELFRARMNPHRDRDTTKEDAKIPQIAGTDVLVITMGDEMMFKLISPDYSKGQDYKFSQTQARENSNKSDLTKDILLSDMSIYVHTSDDDALLQHMASFPPNKSGSRNRIRMALLCRSLGISHMFRVNCMDCPEKRYALVESQAFQQLDKMKHATNWWKQLGYKKSEIPWMDLNSESN